MSTSYTATAIQAVLGDRFTTRATQGGGVQVSVANIQSYGQDDDAKITVLQEGIDGLAKVGYEISRKALRLQSRVPGTNEWKSWPHFFVNKPGSAQANPSAVANQALVAAALSGVTGEALSAIARALGVSLPTTTPSETTEVEDEEEDAADTEEIPM